ncbi:MAG TPA: PilZ domain-containing protein [Thermoanaerobaculia bacterium]|nr:PilZ domain-containing protein [Thermoanaerobaculia bacterium]
MKPAQRLDPLPVLEEEAPGSDRRRHRRVASPGLSGRLPTTCSARLCDVSLSGVGFESEGRLAPARNYRLRLSTGEGEVLDRHGRLVWSHLYATKRSGDGEVRPIYRAGLLFEDRSVGATGELFEFIQRHADEETGAGEHPLPEDRFGIEREATRYQLERIEELQLETDYEFLVRTLSLSGMLFETELPLEKGAQVDLVLELPEGELRGRGRVVSSERSLEGERHRHAIAVEFLELDPNDRDRLERYLQRRLQ